MPPKSDVRFYGYFCDESAHHVAAISELMTWPRSASLMVKLQSLFKLRFNLQSHNMSTGRTRSTIQTAACPDLINAQEVMLLAHDLATR